MAKRGQTFLIAGIVILAIALFGGQLGLFSSTPGFDILPTLPHAVTVYSLNNGFPSGGEITFFSGTKQIAVQGYGLEPIRINDCGRQDSDLNYVLLVNTRQVHVSKGEKIDIYLNGVKTGKSFMYGGGKYSKIFLGEGYASVSGNIYFENGKPAIYDLADNEPPTKSFFGVVLENECGSFYSHSKDGKYALGKNTLSEFRSPIENKIPPGSYNILVNSKGNDLFKETNNGVILVSSNINKDVFIDSKTQNGNLQIVKVSPDKDGSVLLQIKQLGPEPIKAKVDCIINGVNFKNFVLSSWRKNSKTQTTCYFNEAGTLKIDVSKFSGGNWVVEDSRSISVPEPEIQDCTEDFCEGNKLIRCTNGIVTSGEYKAGKCGYLENQIPDLEGGQNIFELDDFFTQTQGYLNSLLNKENNLLIFLLIAGAVVLFIIFKK